MFFLRLLVESAGGKFLQNMFVCIFILTHFWKQWTLRIWQLLYFHTMKGVSRLWAWIHAIEQRSAGCLVVFPFKSLPLIFAPFNIFFSVLWFHHVSRYGFIFIYPACYSSTFSNLEISQLCEYCLFLIMFSFLFWNLIRHMFSLLHTTPLCHYFLSYHFVSLCSILSFIYMYYFISPIFWSFVSIIWSNKS